MPRIDVAPNTPLLVQMLRDPRKIGALPPERLSELIDAALLARLLGWLVAHLDALPPPDPPRPAWIADRIDSARALTRELERALRWEVDRLSRAFFGTGVSWVLLKGAAYLAASLPPGAGRQVADIDVLVPLEQVTTAEAALRQHGWVAKELNEYDERYYREWMHEIPPMFHAERHSVVDLHHGILPRTSRLHPSPERLMAHAVEVTPGVRTLSAPHMVLHGAAHLFHDGEIAGAIRDVVDLDRLLRHFSQQPGFWTELVTEAEALDLRRPAYYAVRYAERMFQTPVPPAARRALAAWAPGAVVGQLMDRLVERAVQGETSPLASTSAFALYVRSHWLKMPAGMLVKHLLKKGTRG